MICAGTLPFNRTEVQFCKTPKMSMKMNAMNRRTTSTLTALAFLWLGVVLPAGNAVGQQAGSTLKDQLAGTWILVSNYTERQDGSKAETFGPNPTGILMFDGNGRLSLQEMRSDLPKFASNRGRPTGGKRFYRFSMDFFCK